MEEPSIALSRRLRGSTSAQGRRMGAAQAVLRMRAFQPRKLPEQRTLAVSQPRAVDVWEMRHGK